MQKIIITGSSGLIGSHILLELSKEYHLHCLVRADSKRINKPNIEYFVMDFMNPTFEKSAFKDVFAVIHLLSVKHSYNPDILAINVEFTKSLVEISIRNKIGKFIYMSSETVQLPGIDGYTRSKKLAEKEVNKYGNHLILRPTVVYGERSNSNIGLLTKLVSYLRIVPVIGTGQQLIQPVHVSNIAKCVVAGLTKNISGTYLIAGRDPLKYIDVVAIIADALDRRILIIRIPIYLCYLIAKLLELFKLPILQKSQVDNLKIDRAYSMEETEKLFGIKFFSPREGIRRAVK